MLTPKYLAGCTVDVVALYDALNTSAVQDMSKRIVKYGKITETSNWQIKQLQECGYLQEDLIRDIATASGYSEKYVRHLFNDAAVQNIRYENDIAKLAGLTPIGINQSPQMSQLLAATIEKTNGKLNNLTLTSAVKTQQAYLEAVNLAYMQVATGVMPYNQAIKNAIKSIAVNGLEVQYDSGAVGKIDSAIRMNVLTAVNQTAGKLTMIYADEVECDLVETTAHMGARPSHQDWQGQIFSRSGRSREYAEFESSTGYGSVDGLCGANCRHNFNLYFEGHSKPAYSREYLDELANRTYDWNGRKLTDFECSARQRQYERTIKEDKRVLSAYNAAIQNTQDETVINTLKEDFQARSVRLKQHEKAMKEFCQATNREVDTFRTQVHAVRDGYGNIVSFDRSTSMKAVWANKRAMNG